jgi:hypothetical protein
MCSEMVGYVVAYFSWWVLHHLHLIPKEFGHTSTAKR